VILFGGRDNGDLGDTWAWDGVTWTQLAPATSPPARGGYAMTYDAAARRIVLFGGGFGPVSYNDTWMFDGTTWTERTPETPPPVRFEAAMIYDPIRHASVIFGGVGLAQALSDTQALTSLGVGITPSIEACVVATDDVDGDGLSGCADPDCWGRCTPLCPPGETCAPDLPRCGDAMCTPPLEDYLICPADCPAP
jgi:hypothetical protein